MPRFEPCPEEVAELANDLINKYADHQPLVVARVKIDLVFAFADRDDQGLAKNYALTKGGVRCLGIARVINLKDRTMGRGDAEVCLDGDHWETSTDRERRALLDHEIHHITPKLDRGGGFMLDDNHRPLIKMRKHDYDFGWFAVIAMRHGDASPERIQAKQMHDEAGQFFWGSILEMPEFQTARDLREHVSERRFKRLA